MKNSTFINSISLSSKIIVIPLILLLGACSTIYVPEVDQSANYDFNSVKTYNLVGDEHLRNPMISDISRDRLDSALDNSMEQKGLSEVQEESADILISYFIVTKDKVKINSSYNTGYYGYNNCYRCASSVGVSHVSTRDYIEGTLVVDIIDNETKRSVWRSTLTKPIKDYDTGLERDQAINTAVKNMMKDLPIS